MDEFKNNAAAYIPTGYSAVATSIDVEAGFGTRFPTPPFNALWWNFSTYPNPDLDPNRELVRVTAISTDTLTIIRAQENTSASSKNAANKRYRFAACITAETLNNDIMRIYEGDPEGVLTGKQGTFLWDPTGKALRIKDTGSGNTGWRVLIG